MEILVIIVTIALFVAFLTRESHKNRIKKKIKSMGGSVIDIKYRSFFTGPFFLGVVEEYESVYEIKYQINSEVKKGWVKFGGFFGPRWKL